MARSEIEELVLRLSADASRLKRELSGTESAVRTSANRMKQTLEGVGGSISKFGGLLGKFGLGAGVGGLLGGAALAQLQDFARGAISAADDVVDAADRIGVSAEALQEWEFGATAAGLRSEQLRDGIEKLGRAQAQAAQGSEAQAAAFARLGVAVRDAGTGAFVPLEQLLPRVADGLKNLGSEQQRLDTAATIFGRGAGPAFVTFLSDGAAGLSDMSARAREMGAVLDEELVRSAAEAADQLDLLEKAAKANVQGALVELAPIMLGIAEATLEAAKAVSSFVDSFRELEQGSTRNLAERFAGNLSAINKLSEGLEGNPFSGMPGYGSASRKEIERRRAENARIEAILVQRAQARTASEAARAGARGAAGVGLSDGDGADKKAAATADRAAREQTRLLEQREAFIESLNRQAAAGSKIEALEVQRIEQLRKAQEIFKGDQEGLAEATDRVNAAFQAQRDVLLNDLVGSYEETSERASKAFSALGSTAMQEIEQTVAAFRGTIADALADMVIQGELSFDALGEAFLRKFVSRAIDGLLEVAAQAAISGIGSAVGGAGGGGWLGAIVGIGTSLIGGAMAGGGSVKGGRAYRVGERGVGEWFIPGMDGAILPSSGGGGGGGGDVSITILNGSGQPAKAEQRRKGDNSREITVAIGELVTRDIGRGGPISKAMEATYGLRRGGSS